MLEQSALTVENKPAGEILEAVASMKRCFRNETIDYEGLSEIIKTGRFTLGNKRLLETLQYVAEEEQRRDVCETAFWMNEIAENPSLACRLFAVERLLSLESPQQVGDFDPLKIRGAAIPKTMEGKIWGAEFENALGRLYGRAADENAERILPLLNRLAEETPDEATNVFLCRCVYGLLLETEERERAFLCETHGRMIWDAMQGSTTETGFAAWSESLTLLAKYDWMIQKNIIENLSLPMNDKRRISLIRLSSVVLNQNVPANYPFEILEPADLPYSRFYRGAARMFAHAPGGERIIHWTLTRNYAGVEDLELPIVGGGLPVIEMFFIWCRRVAPEMRAALFRKACEDLRRNF